VKDVAPCKESSQANPLEEKLIKANSNTARQRKLRGILISIPADSSNLCGFYFQTLTGRIPTSATSGNCGSERYPPKFRPNRPKSASKLLLTDGWVKEKGLDKNCFVYWSACLTLTEPVLDLYHFSNMAS
jgi:hypothetical protein